MKKTYIIPEINVVKVELSNMLAESQLEVLGGSVSDKNAVLGREDAAWDIWDDGEDFEE